MTPVQANDETVYEYREDQELPALPLYWLDLHRATIDFSTGYTFTAKVAARSAPTTTLLTKTTGVAGAASLPNVTVDWSTTDWSALVTASGALPPEGREFLVYVYARRTLDTKDRVFRPGRPVRLRLLPAAS